MECIFCKIVKGEIPSEKIYETKSTLAFLDIFPLNKGHTLVIPKEHRSTFTEIDDETLKELVLAIKKVTDGIINAFSPDGYHILMNVGKTAGQEIEHAHVHVIPRFKDDGVVFGWRQLKYEKDEIKDYAEKLKKAIK